jgi:hypothetical protein
VRKDEEGEEDEEREKNSFEILIFGSRERKKEREGVVFSSRHSSSVCQ